MSGSNPRQMTMVAFLQAQNCSNFPGSWRHAESTPDFMTAAYYQRIAHTLEAGRFDMAFFDDRLAMPDRYGDDFVESVRNGVRVVKMDLIPLMTAMGLASTHLGIGGTYSTTYYQPFHVARTFATLDHMLGGRVAWNVVTSLNDSEAANFGQESHLEHDLRYDLADEFMEAVHGHWDTWEDDAILFDKEGDVFADPSKIHRLDYEGRWIRSRGPFTVPRTPQGRPVIIQAGQSGRGRRFAARWAELMFVVYHDKDYGRREYREVKDSIAALGRNPDHAKLLPAIYCITGETRTIAEEKHAYIESLFRPIDALALLSEVLNFDFATKGLDDAWSEEELASISGLQGLRDRILRISGKKNPTNRDFIEVSGRGTPHDHPVFLGTPREVADQLEDWFVSEACDGFVLAATHVPGAYEDFVRLLVPELQRRGIYRREYPGSTLRDTLGMPKSTRGDWKVGD